MNPRYTPDWALNAPYPFLRQIVAIQVDANQPAPRSSARISALRFDWAGSYRHTVCRIVTIGTTPDPIRRPLPVTDVADFPINCDPQLGIDVGAASIGEIAAANTQSVRPTLTVLTNEEQFVDMVMCRPNTTR